MGNGNRGRVPVLGNTSWSLLMSHSYSFWVPLWIPEQESFVHNAFSISGSCLSHLMKMGLDNAVHTQSLKNGVLEF